MEFKSRPKQASGGGDQFLKLIDGESVVGVFRGKIHTFYNKWVNGKSELASPDDPQAKCRHRVNVVIVVDNKPVARVFEFSDPVYDQLAEINNEYPLESIKIKITRMGIDKNTRYSFIPLAKQPVNIKAIEQVELHILNKNQGPEIPSAEPPPGWSDFPPPDEEPNFEDASEIPFQFIKVGGGLWLIIGLEL